MGSSTRQVLLNVYDLHQSNSWLQYIGVGIYHSGIEVDGVEYTFSEVGIALHRPRNVAAEGCTFKTSEVLGNFTGSLPDLRRILNGLKQEAFAEGKYDLVRKNCNHFCDEFSFALVGKRIPSWVNRAAKIGKWAGFGESVGGVSTSRLGADGATATAPLSRDRKELTKKQRDLLAKMRASKSSAGAERAR
ncbi:unnamed protein product [Ascophyllum nodosum]